MEAVSKIPTFSAWLQLLLATQILLLEYLTCLFVLVTNETPTTSRYTLKLFILFDCRDIILQHKRASWLTTDRPLIFYSIIITYHQSHDNASSYRLALVLVELLVSHLLHLQHTKGSIYTKRQGLSQQGLCSFCWNFKWTHKILEFKHHRIWSLNRQLQC